MAHNEYYTFDQGTVNGKILMNIQVFDEITKKTVSEMKNVSLDTSKGIQIPGTKAVVSCSIKDNEVYVCIHVRLKYGVNVSKINIIKVKMNILTFVDRNHYYQLQYQHV